MRVLVVGSGGREHALCWGVKKSPHCAALFCAPGNAGIAEIAACVPVGAEDGPGLVALCKKENIDFVIVGPDGALVAGVVDALRDAGILAFGPDKAAAMLEGSKGFMKDVSAGAGVPTAKYQRFADKQAALAYIAAEGAPIVIKTDGLAAGKGVVIAQTLDEAREAVLDAMERGKFGASGAEVVIEEFMTGEEVSFFALCDGTRAVAFTSAQDHKAAYDGDKGPNTGGMGAYSPAPVLTAALQDEAMRAFIQPTIDAMAARGAPFRGILYAGLMLTPKGLRLVEYNVRFGDPEAQVMIPRLKTDVLKVLHAAARGRLDEVTLEWDDRAALCVAMAAKGYPGTFEKGSVLRGLDRIDGDVTVFHAGTARDAAGNFIANGGRVLGVTALGADIRAAQKAAYAAVDKIEWPEGFCRRDIGWRSVG